MESRNLQSSRQTRIGTPPKWQEKYLIKRIGDEDIEISLEEHDAILRALAQGQRFVQVRKHTVMLNATKGIEPKWGEENKPPCPKPIIKNVEYTREGEAVITYENQEEIDEWNKYFGK